MTEHPRADELLDLVRGRLTSRRGGEILRHLYAGCEVCLAVAPIGLVAGLGVEREITGKEEAATEAAIDRAFAIALREDRDFRRRKEQRERAVRILVAGGVQGPEKLPRSMKQPDKIEALLAASWTVRFEDIGMMVFFAQFAVSCAEQLDARKHGDKEIIDLQSRALAELGNAYRVSDQFDKAGAALLRSRQLFELGTRSDLLEVRLLDLEASFDADSRRFGSACLRLEKVYRYYQRHGMSHLAGRTLLQLGRYTGFAGEFLKALHLIDESLTLIDEEKDSELVHIAKQNRVEFLVWCRRYRDAEIQLFQLRGVAFPSEGRLTEIRLRWLAGRIEAGQDRFDRAEKTLRGVYESWIEVSSGYNSALVALELAAVLLAQRKANEATEIVGSAYKIFAALNIQREGIMTVLMLRTACELKRATRDLAEKVAKYMAKLEPAPPLEWEE